MTATVPLGEQKQIDVGAIEKELAALWKQPKGEHSNGPQTTRACVMTLVIPVAGERAANEITTVVSKLTDRFPNRAIVIDAVPNAADTMEAWVQAHCQMPTTGSTQICCEQISIEARGSAVERTAGVVLPLLVPDVPVVVWWPRGSPTGASVFARLAPLADRVLVDSATFEQPEQQLGELMRMFAQRAVSDLAWGRLTPWRELTAQFFDSPNTVGNLRELEQVQIHYRPRPDGTLDRVQPLLFVGWLAAKLGWNAPTTAPATADATFTLTRSDGAHVSIELVPESGSEPGATQIMAIELRCSHAHYSIAVAQAPGCALATAQSGSLAAVRRVVRLEQPDLADLLAEELRLFGRDKGYEGALKAAAAIVG